MTKKKKKEQEDWHYCHSCQIARGGTMPDPGKAITVMGGTCSRCGEKSTLIPNNDYDWPKKGKRAWFD